MYERARVGNRNRAGRHGGQNGSQKHHNERHETSLTAARAGPLRRPENSIHVQTERPTNGADGATDTANVEAQQEQQTDANITRTLVWIGVAGLSAALAFTVVRSILARKPADPTSQRIQQLIDEANQLLKTLDDQRHSG